jgi:hypothetical protein
VIVVAESRANRKQFQARSPILDGKTEDYMRDECSLTNLLRGPAQITAALQHFSL